MEQTTQQNGKNKLPANLKEAILASAICLAMVSLTWTFLYGLPHALGLYRGGRGGADWSYMIRGLAPNFIEAIGPVIFLFLIAGFFFGIKNLRKGRTVLAFFVIYSFWFIGCFLTLVINLFIGLRWFLGTITMFLPTLLFYAVFVALLMLILKKNGKLISNFAKILLPPYFIFLIGVVCLSSYALLKLSNLEKRFEFLKSEGITAGNVNSCKEIKNLAEKNVSYAKILQWENDFYNTCIEEAAIFNKEEKICESLITVFSDYIRECKYRVFVSKLDQNNLPKSCKWNPVMEEAFESIPRGAYLKYCLRDIAATSTDPNTCSYLRGIGYPCVNLP